MLDNDVNCEAPLPDDGILADVEGLTTLHLPPPVPAPLISDHSSPPVSFM